MTIHIEWDENDPDLELWNSLDSEGQEKFMLNALRAACEPYTDTEAFDDHVD